MGGKKENLVKVVVPLYKERLDDLESCALDNTMRMFERHPVVFLKPEGLEIDMLARKYPQAQVVRVTGEWLGRKNGIHGYNNMMMDAGFYRLFSSCEYIPICHTDAWIFRDDLEAWCRKGYDLVAAPWPLRPRYKFFPLKRWLKMKAALERRRKGASRMDMYGRVGNGGLSLRRVDSCIGVLETQSERVALYQRKQYEDGLYYEDLFWSMVPRPFRYPTAEEALDFAFDLKPKLCYSLNDHKLPMGCHGFQHKSRIDFWRKFIPCLNGSR